MTKYLILLLLTVSTNLFAFKIPLLQSFDVSSESESNQEDYNFEAIVKMASCSGSIVKFNGQPDSAKALMMTNGHCIKDPKGFLKPNEIRFNVTDVKKMHVFDKEMKLYPIQSTKLIYATMTNTDFALYELESTYLELKRLGINAFVIDSNRPHLGMNIDIVSGYWDRGYRCHIDEFVYELVEGQWVFTDSIRYSDSGCETIGGTSGSPIIQTNSRVVVGINNTGNRKGGRCQLNNPCERDDNGDILVKKRSYGQQVYNVYTCLRPDFQIDLTITGCQLPK